MRGGLLCNENPLITPSTNVLGFYAIYQTKDQSLAVLMVHKTLFYLSNFNSLRTFLKSTLIYTVYIFLYIVKKILTKVERHAVFSKTNI